MSGRSKVNMNRSDYIKSKVDILLSKLYNYKHYHIQALYLEEELKEYAAKVQDMTRPKTIKTDTIRTQNPIDQTKVLNVLFSEQMEIEREYYLMLGKMKEIDTIINLIPDKYIQEIAQKKFVCDVSWTELSKESNCDRGTLVYRIKRELSKII